MSYMFKHIERRVYDSTFLQQVDIRVEYDRVVKGSVSSDFGVKLFDFIKNFFNCSIDNPEEVFFSKSLFFINQEEQVAFNFSPEYTQISIGHKNYMDFYRSALSKYSSLSEFLFNIIKAVNLKVYLRKVNVFPVKLEDNTLTENVERQVFDLFLSDDLLGVEPDKSLEVLNNKPVSVDTRIVDSDSLSYSFRTFVLSSLEDEKSMGFFLDILVGSVISNSDSSSLYTSLLQINDSIYDAFHWAVRPVVIEMMSHKDKCHEQK